MRTKTTVVSGKISWPRRRYHIAPLSEATGKTVEAVATGRAYNRVGSSDEPVVEFYFTDHSKCSLILAGTEGGTMPRNDLSGLTDNLERTCAALAGMVQSIKVDLAVSRTRPLEGGRLLEVWGHVGDYEVCICLPAAEARRLGLARRRR